MALLRIEYPTLVLLRELVMMEVDSCIASVQTFRLRESSLALMYEQRASLLMDFLDVVELLLRR